MKINVFGLGYVGSVSAACLAAGGHEVVGIDIDRNKIDTINRGDSIVIEQDLPELISRTVASGKAAGRCRAASRRRRFAGLRRHAEQREREPVPRSRISRRGANRNDHPDRDEVPRRLHPKHRPSRHGREMHRADPGTSGRARPATGLGCA